MLLLSLHFALFRAAVLFRSLCVSKHSSYLTNVRRQAVIVVTSLLADRTWPGDGDHWDRDGEGNCVCCLSALWLVRSTVLFRSLCVSKHSSCLINIRQQTVIVVTYLLASS